MVQPAGKHGIRHASAIGGRRTDRGAAMRDPDPDPCDVTPAVCREGAEIGRPTRCTVAGLGHRHPGGVEATGLHEGPVERARDDRVPAHERPDRRELGVHHRGDDDDRQTVGGEEDVGHGTPRLPVVVAAAIVHAELATVRPFVRANAVVARALDRAVVQAGGLDPTGVAVTEAGHGAAGGAAYLGALAAYGRGDVAGVGLWITHCCSAVRAAAAEGERVADAVLAGRLDR